MSRATGMVIWAIAALMYGGTNPGVAQGLKYMTPGLFQFFRMLFGFVGAVLIVGARYIINKNEYRQIFKSHFRSGIKPILWICFGGLLNLGIPHCLIAIAQQWVPSCAVTLMVPFQTSTGAIFGHFLLEDEKINIYKLISVGLSIVGIICNGVPAFRNSGMDGGASTMEVMLGYIFLLIAMSLFGLALPVFRRKCQNIDPSISVAIQLVPSAIFEGLYSLIFDGPQSIADQIRSCPPVGWLWPVLIGVLISGVALNLYMVINDMMGAFACNLVPFGQMIVGLLISIFLLGEWDHYLPWEIALNTAGAIILMVALIVGFMKPKEPTELSDMTSDELDDMPTDKMNDMMKEDLEDRVVAEL